MFDSVVSAIQRTVPISQFNRGLAGKIFSDVRSTGSKVVIKNNEPEVVLVSPDQYIEIMDALNDYELLALALERLEHYDASTVLPEEKVWARLGITDDDLNISGEVEFE